MNKINIINSLSCEATDRYNVLLLPINYIAISLKKILPQCQLLAQNNSLEITVLQWFDFKWTCEGKTGSPLPQKYKMRCKPFCLSIRRSHFCFPLTSITSHLYRYTENVTEYPETCDSQVSTNTDHYWHSCGQ